jgi:uncharacterized metal-binding protein YceD (DUF177 family)
MRAEPEFSILVNCNKLQEKGKTLETEAKSKECKALAKRFDLLSLDKLKLKAFISRQSAETVLLQCNFIADYVQKCVVSLKPLEKNIDCSFERIYSFSVIEYFSHESEPQEKYFQNSEDSRDPPDPLIDGYFNLGECVAEQLSLELNPFPRFKGINFNGFSSSQGEQISKKNTGPFAVLEQLKKKL